MCMDFYKDYFSYVGDTESPRIYHRWAAVSMIAALLGRQFYFPFGHSLIYPNFYIFLVGTPGTRKSESLKPARRALSAAGYKKFAPDRTSPERFIADLVRVNSVEIIDDEELEKLNFEEPSEMYVNIGELSDFFKKGSTDFMNLLTNLWDNLPKYEHPKLHGKSIYVPQPTVNIISGTTQQTLSDILPIQAIGQGFLSRIVLVEGESPGTKITFPKYVPDELVESYAKTHLMEIKEKVHGEIIISSEVRTLCDRLYREIVDLEDYRFKHYMTRRFTHLLKLAMIFCAMRTSTNMITTDMLQANTLLYVTEQRMPKALGEFGKATNSDVANTILEIVRNAKKPINQREIWKQVSQDLNKFNDLIDILKNLMSVQKIQQITVAGKQGFLPFTQKINGWSNDLLVEGFLTREEEV